ncbi:MAG: putative DNA binding domain-containing protein [Candidatus Liptonbacteria bacterium]|nr:putative DNA binding domain-containing protein [Candidatus Liptonbacteria bacterium]
MTNGEVSIKRSPIVVIRTLVLIELCAFVAYYLAAALGNYKYEFFLQIPLLPDLISYQALKFLLLSGAQFVITVYAFLCWYYESYVIRPGAILHTRGVFFKQSTMTPLHTSMSFTIHSGPFKNLLHYGTIHIRENASAHVLTLADISRPETVLAVIEKSLTARPVNEQAPREQPTVSHLLAEGEHDRLEFKSSLRFDHRTKQVNREIERTALKTIAAFLNSSGGHLVLGVDDARRPVGIHYDYATIGRQDRDGFENHFTQVFNKMIGAEFRHLARLRFHALEGKEVCVVDVEPSAAPVYLRLDNNDEHFYVRTGNVSTPLRLSEVESYTRSRWPQHAHMS